MINIRTSIIHWRYNILADSLILSQLDLMRFKLSLRLGRTSPQMTEIFNGQVRLSLKNYFSRDKVERKT